MGDEMAVDQAVEGAVRGSVDDSELMRNEALRLAAQKKRSVLLGLLLLGFVVLVGTISALQLKKNIQRSSNANAATYRLAAVPKFASVDLHSVDTYKTAGQSR